MIKRTLVIGASENPSRYSYKAIHKLKYYGHDVLALGLKSGNAEGTTIATGTLQFKDVDTVTLYLSEKNQQPIEDYILSLKPKRIIFNPGAENPSLKLKAEREGIETVEACTLVMLSIGGY